MSDHNTKLKNFYLGKYPDDEVGNDIFDDVTFEDLFLALDNYQDVYKYIGAFDSIVRERLFEELSNISGHTYEEIYNKWLKI